jgi:hypothetical protein
MPKDEGFIKNLLVWSYQRGTLQYDIICAIILAFIFFMPPSCFVAKREVVPPQTYDRSASTTHSEKAINPVQPEPQRKRN